jgi:hypothetical protein
MLDRVVQRGVKFDVDAEIDHKPQNQEPSTWQY